FFIIVGVGQHLPFTDAVRFGLVGVDLLHAAGLDAPGVVDQNFRVHPELPVEHIFVVEAGTGQFPHGVDAVLFQPAHRAGAHLPEVGQGLVVPQQVTEGVLVQLRDADAVLVGGGVLGGNVHSQLGQVKVGANTRRGGDAGGVKHLPDHGLSQAVRGHVVVGQVRHGVDEYLVDGVDHHVLGGHIFQVDAVDLTGDLLVVGHSGRGHQVTDFQRGV